MASPGFPKCPHKKKLFSYSFIYEYTILVAHIFTFLYQNMIFAINPNLNRETIDCSHYLTPIRMTGDV